MSFQTPEGLIMPAHCLSSVGFSLSLKDAEEHEYGWITSCSFHQAGTSLVSRKRSRQRSPWSPWSLKDMFPLISASKRLKFQQFRVLSPTAASKWWEQEFPGPEFLGNHCDQEFKIVLRLFCHHEWLPRHTAGCVWGGGVL